MDWSSVLPALLGAVIAIILEHLRQRFLVKKTAAETEKLDAEADKIVSEARKVDAEVELLIGQYWRELSAEMERQNIKVRADLALTRAEVVELRRDFVAFHAMTNKNIRILRNILIDLWAGVCILMKQLRTLNVEPEWQPDDRLKEYCEQLSTSDAGK